MTTMKEVAERTGVSVSTVSLVLNDRDEGRVKPAIAEQVRATAKRLDYRPNPLARSLRTSKTRILGFISEEIAATPHAGGIILGAQDAASKLGYMLLTVNTDGNSDEAREIATLKRYGVDGFLYAKMSNRFTDVPKPLHDYPLVLVDDTDRTGRYASIEPDETLIGYDATKRLIDARAWYVYENAARRGLVVGRDVSVVGVDNHRVFAETLEPQLTTVELPHYEMGYWATRKLVSLIEGREPDDDEPETTAPLPPLDASIPAKIHCTLIDKQSVAQR